MKENKRIKDQNLQKKYLKKFRIGFEATPVITVSVQTTCVMFKIKLPGGSKSLV